MVVKQTERNKNTEDQINPTSLTVEHMGHDSMEKKSPRDQDSTLERNETTASVTENTERKKPGHQTV